MNSSPHTPIVLLSLAALTACSSDPSSSAFDAGVTTDGSTPADAGQSDGMSPAMDGSGAALDGSSPGLDATSTDGPCVPTSEICGDGIDQDCNGPDLACPELFDPSRVTTWRPGILSDDQLGLALGDDGLPVRNVICANLNPGDDIQTAIDGCDEGQVVELAAGTFRVSNTVTLTKGIVLRGAGSQGAPSGTTIVKTGGESVLEIGTDRDSICYGGNGRALTDDATKETNTIAVGSAAAASFRAGDLALVDEVDGAEVDQGDCGYFKRESGRSVSQRVEVQSVSGGNVTLSSPLHFTFKRGQQAELTRVTQNVTRWAGIEHLRVQGGTNPGYNGQMAGGIDISNAAYSWVKDVQTDETIGGMHVALTGTYRVVVRDSYLHHSADYGFGRDCYGIVLRCGAADNLVENNVVRYMNKPILFNVSGGGNVVGYNYVDNSWADPPAWQEVNIDCHCSFPHMELIEGNYAPHVGATTTHGNAGYLTFFRNYSSSVFAPPAVVGSSEEQSGNISAVQVQDGDLKMNVVGCVLGADGVSTDYESGDSNAKAIFGIGSRSDVAVTSMFRHGNFDYVNHAIRWDPSVASQVLPASLYYAARPAWWPAGTAWPWVGPDLQPMVGELPAHAR